MTCKVSTLVSAQDRPGVPAHGAVPTKRHVVGGSVLGSDKKVAVAGKDAVSAIEVIGEAIENGTFPSIDWRAVDKKRTIARTLILYVVECTPTGDLALCFGVRDLDAVGVRSWEGDGKIDGE